MTEERRCIFCKSMDIKKCDDCGNFLCNDCIISGKSMAFVIKKHDICVECNDQPVCFKSICYKCDIHPYHMIDEKIGIGSCSSSYKDFDIIVNLNYPENGVKEDKMEVKKRNNKMIIFIGLINSDYKENDMYKYLIDIIPVLYKFYRDKKILFHCYSGISRSATFAIAYLAYLKNISVENALKIVSSKRKFIKPNYAFLNALDKFQDYMKYAKEE